MPDPLPTEGSGHSCIHFWCSWNALNSEWDFCLKPDVGRIALRLYNSRHKEALAKCSCVCFLLDLLASP